MVRNNKLAQHSQIPKSERACLNCHIITVWGYNSFKGHSCCTKCGADSKKGIFIRWCDIRRIPPEWQKRKCRLSQKQLEKWKRRTTNRVKKENDEYDEQIDRFNREKDLKNNKT